MKVNRRIRISAPVLVTGVFLALAAAAWAGQVAPDATPKGPLEITSAEYQFPAAIDDDVLPGTVTEIWARLYRPKDLSGGPYPVLVFLHGNHATCGFGENPRIDTNCQYTFNGTCPANWVVVPNHEGYGYLADRLASWGYITVSINANRGINCRNDGPPTDRFLNLTRGRLILKHLQLLSEWNTSGGTPPSLDVDLKGKLDFSQVGLLGHSRGGEGARAAYNLYRDDGSPWPNQIPDPVLFSGIFEIGPVDGQTPRILNADGMVWNVLLPMCDGDVTDLQGVKPFDRMLRIFTEAPATQKSTYTVWGANHNYYSTEWQQTDSPGCIGPGNEQLWSGPVGSPEQRQTALASVLAFFRGNVATPVEGGFDSSFNQNFNPQYGLPDVITQVTRVDRGYTDSPSEKVTLPFEDFDQPVGTNTYGFANDDSNITILHSFVPNHAPTQRAGVISWKAAGDDTFFQTNWADPKDGRDISAYQTLDLRVSRQNNGNLNPVDPTNFSIRLVQADGTLSDPVPLNAYTDLRGPVGGAHPRAGFHPILQTARIPLKNFGGVDLTRVRGVRLTFNDTKSGAIYVTNIRLSSLSGSALSGPAEPLAQRLDYKREPVNRSAPPVINNDTMNIIRSIRTVPSAGALEGKAGVEIELVSVQGFPVRNELVVLNIGGRPFDTSRYAEGDTHVLVFTLTPEEFAQVQTGDEVTVHYGRSPSNERWNFGRLDKAMLDK